jgi:DNA polymerase/3'-5' exonuclease PolX
MSKSKMLYSTAKRIADHLVELLRPHCIRIEIAGSIRREQEVIGDVEICLIPKPYETGLFTSGIASVLNPWEKVKGELVYGKCKYTQRIVPDEIVGVKGKRVALDVFIACEENWGLIFAIRTGSSDYSHKVLADGWVKRGYKSEGGILTQGGKTYEVREEIDLFNRIGIPYCEPKNRHI